MWFVPREALETTRDAVFAAGAGRIGDYERCSWYTAGTGTFFGGEGTEPSIGQAGREERVAELRVETVVAEERLRDGRRRARRGASVRRGRVRRVSARRGLKAKLFTDGGARGNPGPAAYGFVLEAEDGTVLAAHGEKIGVATNNVAEYRALIAGLAQGGRAGGARGRGRLRLGAAREADDGRLPREERRPARAVAGSRAAWPARIGKVTYTAVRREHNELADRLVNEALDARVARLYWPAPRGCSSVG